MTLSLYKQPQPETYNEPRVQVDSTELLRSIELLSQSESIFPVHLKTQVTPLINKLTLILSDIDKQCQNARETLESETIRTSALRYKFVNMPNAIQTEMLQVVMSARMSNKALIDDLQNKVISMEEEMERLKKDQEITDLHNSVLVPTMKNLQKQYDSAIDYLNNMLTMRFVLSMYIRSISHCHGASVLHFTWPDSLLCVNPFGFPEYCMLYRNTIECKNTFKL